MSSPLQVCCVCGRQLTVAATGRPRRYCSERCRERARRAREAEACREAAAATEAQLEAPTPGAAVLETALSQLVGLPPGRPERVVESLIMEARSLSAAFGVAGRRMPPQLAWRCEALAEHIANGLKAFLEVP